MVRKESCMNDDRYPEDDDIELIRNYDPGNSPGWAGLVELIRSAWNSNMGSIRQDGHMLILTTGG